MRGSEMTGCQEEGGEVTGYQGDGVSGDGP